MRPFSDSSLAVVHQWYAAYDARDVDGLVAITHPDIEITPASPLLSRLPGTAFHGHTGLRTLMKWSYEAYARVRVESSSARVVNGEILATATFVVGDGKQADVRQALHTLFLVDDGLIRRVRAFASEADALAAGPGTVLTPREREVFELLARGLNAPQIAKELYLSPATVRTHVQNGMARLGAATRIQAVTIALERGEIHP